MAPAFGAACTRLFRHPRVAEIWPEYLITQHAIIRTTVPLMEAGRDRARSMAEDDRVAAGVESYLDVHIGEEQHHDDWLLDDLEAIGVSRKEALKRVPSPTVAALAGSQYYWLLHYHPVALLGYFAFMEGFPPKPEMIRELIERTGLPEAAFRTLALHGELDPGHLEELDRTIDALPLTGEQEIALGLSAISTANWVTSSLEEIAEEF
jgi:pyrroloquinoline quinone (PQQ) biosynthesis protein C